jgi:hypothetical protein
MKFSLFFSSFFGMYVTQSCVHALIAAVIIDMAIQIWEIDNPSVRQRFRIIIIFIALLSYPLYQLMNPQRGAVAFRLETLFDSSRWLSLQLWNAMPLGLFFICLLVLTSAVFLFQELIPIVRHAAGSERSPHTWEKLGEQSEVAGKFDLLRDESGYCPDFYVTEDEYPILFSRTGKKPSIHLSTGIISSLTPEELRGAIAHEEAHILRNRKPLLIAVFFLRMILFFNPIVLLSFRRIVLDEEKICDDMAIASTKNPHALAETLKKLYYNPEAIAGEPDDGSFARHQSHDVHVEKRIRRIEAGTVRQNEGRQWGRTVTVSFFIIAINYFVV